MNPARDRLLLASIHDVAPCFETEVDRLVDELESMIGTRFAMLVVPNHWGGALLSDHRAFAVRLRRWSEAGIEMILHGFYHKDDAQHRGLDRIRARHMTASEGEFLGLAGADAERRINDGRAIIEDIIGVEVRGFVAPAWLYGEGAKRALRRCGMGFAENHWSVWAPDRDDAVLARGPVITWASRSAGRRRASLAAAAVLRRVQPQRVLRVGVHPGDASHPALLRSLERTMAAAMTDRQAGRYADLLADACAEPASHSRTIDAMRGAACPSP